MEELSRKQALFFVATVAVAHALATSAMEEGMTGISMAKLLDIESAIPDKHRILADGTSGTYWVDEKWRFATGLLSVIAPHKPLPQFPERNTKGLSKKDREMLKDRDSRSIMILISTIGVPLGSSAEPPRVVDPEATTPLDTPGTRSLHC